MISLRSQPEPLKLAIKLAIDQSTADLVFDNAYPAIEDHASYLRLLLCNSARSLKLTGYVRRFDQDAQCRRAFGQVVRGLAFSTKVRSLTVDPWF